MPCRSWMPEVVIRKPAAASPPSTVGPCQPTVAWAATPAGLSTATMSSSEYRIVMPSMSTGVFSGGAGASGSRTSSQAPGVRRSDLPTGVPSRSTPPSSASAAAAVRDRPSSLASPASTRMPASPSGTGIERVSIRRVRPHAGQRRPIPAIRRRAYASRRCPIRRPAYASRRCRSRNRTATTQPAGSPHRPPTGQRR